MPSAQQMEKHPAEDEAGEHELTLKQVEAGFGRLVEFFGLPEGVAEHIPEAEVRNRLQVFQREFTGFLVNQVGKSFDRASEQAQSNFRALAEILSSLPKGVTKFEKTKDKKSVSLAIESPTNSVRLDIHLGEERHAQQIRLGLRDAEGNETLVLDAHYYPPRNRLQMELKGRGLGGATLRHKDFPAECSGQETLTQLQLALVINLCPTEGEDDKTTARYLQAKETYLKQLLKELGIRGKVAKDKKRGKIINDVMAQHAKAKKRRRKAEEMRQGAGQILKGAKKKTREAAQQKKEGREQIALVTQCANKLTEVVAKTPSLTGWLIAQREKRNLPPEVTDGRIVLGFILDMKPDELDEEAKGCELSSGEKIFLSDLPDLTAQTIRQRQDLEQSAEDALEDMKDLAEAMRGYEG